MKKIMLVAVLAMASTTFGAGFALQGPVGDVEQGMPFSIKVAVDTAVAPIDAWEFTLVAPAEMQVLSSAMVGGWANGYATTIPAGALNGAYAGGFQDPAVLVAGPVIDIQIAGLPMGVYAVVMDYGVALAGGNPVIDVPAEPLMINVTPEPVSALLLLAGLPMLRRRR